MLLWEKNELYMKGYSEMEESQTLYICKYNQVFVTSGHPE